MQFYVYQLADGRQFQLDSKSHDRPTASHLQ